MYKLCIADVEITAFRTFRNKPDKLVGRSRAHPVTIDENLNIDERYKKMTIRSIFGDRIKPDKINAFSYKFNITNIK
jgi:hypothetical protein